MREPHATEHITTLHGNRAHCCVLCDDNVMCKMTSFVMMMSYNDDVLTSSKHQQLVLIVPGMKINVCAALRIVIVFYTIGVGHHSNTLQHEHRCNRLQMKDAIMYTITNMDLQSHI